MHEDGACPGEVGSSACLGIAPPCTDGQLCRLVLVVPGPLQHTSACGGVLRGQWLAGGLGGDDCGGAVREGFLGVAVLEEQEPRQ